MTSSASAASGKNTDGLTRFVVMSQARHLEGGAGCLGSRLGRKKVGHNCLMEAGGVRVVWVGCNLGNSSLESNSVQVKDVRAGDVRWAESQT